MASIKLRLECLEERLTPAASVNYQYFRNGAKADAQISTTDLGGGAALVGGGSDVNEVYKWMGLKARHGDFLILGTYGNGYNNNTIDRLNSDKDHKLNSVSTLIISGPLDAAGSKAVAQIISQAEAIFIQGGDQSTYVGLWKDNAVETAIQDRLNKNVVIGGTSAGLAVLGQYVYTGAVASAESSNVLMHTNDPSITITNNFLNVPYLQSTITDTHFHERDRMGRLVTFMAYITTQMQPSGPVHGIGVDQETALLVETKTMTIGNVSQVAGKAKIVANATTDPTNTRHVYFLQAPATPPTNTFGAPLSWSSIYVHKGSPLEVVDMSTIWVNLPIMFDYRLFADIGVLTARNRNGLLISIY